MAESRTRKSTSTPPAPKAGADVDEVEVLLAHARDGEDSIQLWVHNASSGQFRYLEPFEPTAMRGLGVREFTRQRYGGGKFRAKIRRRDGTYGLARTFDIDGVFKSPTLEATAVGAPAAAAAGTAPPAWLERIILPIGVTFATGLASYLVKKMFEDPKADPLMLELIKRSARDGGVDPLELQRAIAEAETRGETRGRELGKLRAIADQPREMSGALGAIDRALPQVLDVVKRKLRIDEERARVGPPSPTDAPAETAADQTLTPGTAPTADPLAQLLLSIPLMAREFLLSAAEGDEPPEIYAGMVLGKLDDVTYARMPALLERSDFVDVLVATWPAFGDHRPWVEQFAAAMRDTLEASKPETDDDDAEPGAGETKTAP